MKFENIKILFFDLDNTLFDHSRSERASLKILHKSMPGLFSGVDENEFLQRYDHHNKILWKQMADGVISADELRILRFKITCDDLGVSLQNPEVLSQRYLETYTRQKFVFPNTMETLAYLKPKFKLCLLSNGFVHIQKIKLKNIGLADMFAYEIYSGDVGVMKPHPGIFQAAMEKTGAAADEIVYIGDSYDADIVGAKSVNWFAILFDPESKYSEPGLADLKISDLIELKNIF